MLLLLALMAATSSLEVQIDSRASLSSSGTHGLFVVPDDNRKSSSTTTLESQLPLSRGSLNESVDEWIDRLSKADEKQRLTIDEQIRQVVQDKVGLAEAFLEAKDLASAQGEFEKAIGLVSGLLAAGYPQPWMYQALSLGMEACDYPAADIKRVLLSSLDFNGDSNQAYVIAAYLARKGMRKEALELLKDIAIAEPQRYDVFALALPLAEETQDTEAMCWICTGVLSKVWPKEHAALFEHAKLAARATQLRLQQTGRPIEASIFENEIKASMLRDIIVRVNWTGHADLDIRVREPAGSICSLTNPQTISGGVLLGDTSSSNSPPSVDGYSEFYACAQGYAGRYDVLIRRVWGNVSAGKATVEIYTDYGTPEQSFVAQQVDLSDKDALVQVDVKHGHRQEPIVEAQLARVRMQQTNVGREVLGQVSGSSADAADYASYRRLLAVAGNNAGPGFGFGFPIGRGAVGYRPVVTVIPEMASIAPSAVISADRRYVRITPNPIFTQIGEVLTYNSSTGAQGQNQGGSGTQGGFTGGGVGGAGGANTGGVGF